MKRNKKSDLKKILTLDKWVDMLYTAPQFKLSEYYQNSTLNFTKVLVGFTIVSLILISFTLFNKEFGSLSPLFILFMVIEVIVLVFITWYVRSRSKSQRENEIDDFIILNRHIIDKILSGDWSDTEIVYKKNQLKQEILDDKYSLKKYPDLEIEGNLLDGDNYSKRIKNMKN